MKAVAAAAGIPFRTAQRWVSLYWQFGLTALARKRRTDARQDREMSAQLKEAIEGIALRKPPIPVTAICRQTRRVSPEMIAATVSWAIFGASARKTRAHPSSRSIPRA